MEKSENIIYRKVLDHAMLMPLHKIKDGDFYGLNNSGSFLWEHLESFQTIEDMAYALVKEFDVDFKTAYAGAQEFYQDLKELEVIQ